MSTPAVATYPAGVKMAPVNKTVPIRAGKSASKRRPPRIGRPRGQLSEETRKRILAAARECFARLGFERATNKDIASAARITAAALYRYFDSKAELYAAVVQESSAIQVLRLRQAVESTSSVKAAFGAMLRTLGEDSQSAHARVLSGVPTEMQRHPEVAKRMIANPGELAAIIDQLVKSGVRKKEIPRAKAERTVALMIASLIGITSYINALGRDHGELAVAGLLDVLEGRLFGALPDT